MVNMMKALVFTAPHTFEYRDVPRPEPAPDEVLVEVKACAICGSDVHGSSGENGRRIPPLVMGHEASGTIAQLGEAVQSWAVGDRVTFDSTEYCGHCWFCTHGMHNLCAQRRIVGVACTEYRKNGAMAQYIAVKARTLYALPPAVSFEQGCLVEPFAVGMHAVLRSGLAAGQTAAVIGDGTIGLMTLIAAKSQGAQVCISGHHARPMQLAAQLGALDCAQLPQLTAERGADVVYDAVGSQSSFTQAMELVRKGGRIMVIGNHSRTIDFPLQRCITEQIDVQFSYSSAGEYPVCLQAIAEGRADLTGLWQSFPLAEGAQVFDRLVHRDESLTKAILIP